MKNQRVLLALGFLLILCGANSQSYNREYIKNLKYRLLLSYVSETRELNSLITPDKKFDLNKKEALNLRNSPNIYSGLLLQTGNLSFYWASTLPQSQSDIQKFGKQSANLSKVSIIAGPVLINFNYVNQKGLYDDNYLKHPEFTGDTMKYRRHNALGLKWISTELNYYPGREKMCLGVPAYFGERQLKSKFTMGSRLAHNFIRLDNDGRSFFRDSFALNNPEFNLSYIKNNTVSFALTPAVYLVSKNKMFLYAEASMGYGVGKTVTDKNSKNNKRGQFEFPQAKVAVGINSDRFLAGVYYTYLNQNIKVSSMTVGNLLGNWGFILGIRINQYKCRFLKWDTI